MNNAKNTQINERPLAVLVCKKIPSPTWLNGSMPCAKLDATVLITVGKFVVDENGDAVELATLFGAAPDIISFN